MRKGCRIWGNAERVDAELFDKARAHLPFDVVEFADGSLNVEHEASHVDEDTAEDAANAIAQALGEGGFGQLDLIDQNQDFVLRFSIAPGEVKSRRTGSDNVLEKYHHE